MHRLLESLESPVFRHGEYVNKSTKSDQVEICIKVPFGKSRKFAQTAFNVNKLDKQTFITKMSALHEKIMPIPELNMAQLK